MILNLLAWMTFFFLEPGCLLRCREIELPEPVEFLKSMGFSLTPLNEAASIRGLKVLCCLCAHLQL